jgi:hypothetical protein
MKAIEFYTTPDGEVILKAVNEPEKQLCENDSDFIQAFLGIIKEFYPKA